MNAEWIRSVNESIQRNIQSNAKRREEITSLENELKMSCKDLEQLLEWKKRFDEVASVTQIKENFEKLSQFNIDHHQLQLMQLIEWQQQFTNAMTLTQLQDLIRKVNQLELDNARSKMVFWVVQAGIGLLVGIVTLFGAFKTAVKTTPKTPAKQTRQPPSR